MKLKLFYVWLLPAIWVGITVGSFFNSGDEHGCFCLGVIVFWWLHFIFGSINSTAHPLLFLIPSGMIIIALSGLLLDLLRASWKIMAGFSAAGFIVFLILLVMGFESLQDIRYKHGSILAPILSAANMGLYAGILFSLIISAFSKLANRNKAQTQL